MVKGFATLLAVSLTACQAASGGLMVCRERQAGNTPHGLVSDSTNAREGKPQLGGDERPNCGQEDQRCCITQMVER